jgi:hypothetical protein
MVIQLSTTLGFRNPTFFKKSGFWGAYRLFGECKETRAKLLVENY